MIDNVLSELAEELLLRGKDRVPHRFDKRTLRTLRRQGLLTYPDGTYSLSEGAMAGAIKWWRLVTMDPYADEHVRKKFLQLMELAQRWQQPPPQIAGMRYAELTYAQYVELWGMVLQREIPIPKDAPSMSQKDRRLFDQLEKRGYVTMTLKGNTFWIEPTPKGTQLVNDLGSPNPNHRTASYDFRGRARE